MYLISCFRAEERSWSPPILEDGKAQAYRINIEPEPQVGSSGTGAGWQSWVWKVFFWVCGQKWQCGDGAESRAGE